MRTWLSIAIWKADLWRHRLGLPGHFLCNWLDISCGFGPSLWDEGLCPNTWSNRLVARIFGSQ